MPDRMTQSLKALCLSRGFSPIELPPFEAYSLYGQHAGFCQEEPMLTFTAPSGTLMALRPDATLTLARRGQSGRQTQKLVYEDTVYRMDKQSGQFALIRQLGVEIIGRGDPFSDIELADLALDCLAVMGEHALDIAHLGLVTAIMESSGLDEGQRTGFMAALRAKSVHQLAGLLAQAGLPGDEGQRLSLLCRRLGPLPKALAKLAPLRTTATAWAFDALEALAGALGDKAGRVNLDFSVTGDLSYYSGLALSGYVQGMPRAVLTGGRYDGLMAQLGRQPGQPGSAGAGFAINLSLVLTRPEPGPGLYGRYRAGHWGEALAWQREQNGNGVPAGLLGPEEPVPASARVVQL